MRGKENVEVIWVLNVDTRNNPAVIPRGMTSIHQETLSAHPASTAYLGLAGSCIANTEWENGLRGRAEAALKCCPESKARHSALVPLPATLNPAQASDNCFRCVAIRIFLVMASHGQRRREEGTPKSKYAQKCTFGD